MKIENKQVFDVIITSSAVLSINLKRDMGYY